jgi:Oxidoreductase family, NAD-binding Rossmann fold
MNAAAARLRVGLIGLDSSHVVTFTKLLQDASDPHHVPGLQVVAAFPGGSPTLPLSTDRIRRFTDEIRVNYGVAIVDSIAALPGDLDAVFLHSVDGRQHLGQFKDIVGRKLPVFIDKPLATCPADAEAIARLAGDHGTPIMTCSALRFAEALEQAAAASADDPILGGEFYGPMPILAEPPGYFWYGIHAVEMLYRALGTGCRRVSAVGNDRFDTITAEWGDGRIALVRGNRVGNAEYGGTIHRQKCSQPFKVSAGREPYYVSLLRAIVRFITTRRSPVPLEESLELIRFLAAANASRAQGAWVAIG